MMKVSLLLSLLGASDVFAQSCSDPGPCSNPQACVLPPSAIEFLFRGGGCVDTSGISGSSQCATVGTIPKLGTPSCTEDTYTISITGSQSETYFSSATIKLGDTIRATGMQGAANLAVSIVGNGSQHSYQFQPSCSSPLSLGAIMATLEVTAIDYRQGGGISCGGSGPGPSPPMPTPSTPMPMPTPRSPPPPSPQPSASLCFSSLNTVFVQDKGEISIEKLQIGDIVATSHKGHTSRVYSLAHNDGERRAEYLQIITDSGDRIEISGNHMMFVNHQPKLAQHVKLGDRLDETQTVTEIQVVTRRGLYAPLTENGRIMVSGVQASTYVGLLDVDTGIQVFVYHSVLSLLRLVCKFHFGSCKAETYSKQGYANTVVGFLKFTDALSQYHPSVQWSLVIVAAPTLAILRLFEVIASNTVILALCCFFVFRYKQARVATSRKGKLL